MKRVIFFLEPEWAFGTVHYELFKYLWGYGFNCQLLPWNKSYTVEEMRELNDTVDLFVTTPHGWRFLGYNYCVVDPAKCVIVAHAKIDYTELIHLHGYNDFDKFYKFAAVSEWLVSLAGQLGIQRVPDHCPIGINFNTFYSPPNDSLRVVGYAGSYNDRSQFSEADIKSNLALPKYHKRSWLVKEATERAGLEFRAAETYHKTFITMPGFYKNVDAVICASTEEGAGLPVLEGGAAGKLVIGTPVGHWQARVAPYGGDTVPVDEQEFLDNTITLLSYYKNNPDKYRARCMEIQHHAQGYDWKYVIDRWVSLLT